MNFHEAVLKTIELLEEEATAICGDLPNLNNPENPAEDYEEAAVHLLELEQLITALRAEPTDEHPIIRGPADVDRLLRNRIAYQKKENFVVILMDTQNRVIAAPTVAKGTTTACVIDPGDVIREALYAHSPQIIVAHNHPSGDTTPSLNDKRTTERLKKGADYCGIELLDHVIIGRDYRSLREFGCL